MVSLKAHTHVAISALCSSGGKVASYPGLGRVKKRLLQALHHCLVYVSVLT